MSLRVIGIPPAFLHEWFDDNDYVIAHTSGSTGAPRSIKLLKSDMLASAALSNDYFGVACNSALLLCLSPDHIAGKMMIVRAILAGATLVVVEPARDPLPAIPSRVKIRLASMVPMQVSATLANPHSSSLLSRVQHLLIGGASLSPRLEESLRALPIECHASYGMTETLSHVALRRVNGPCASSLYSAIGNVSFDIDDRGCLAIHAPHLSARSFVTNDLARVITPSSFQFLGRYDNIINSGGLKISPESIERLISPHLSRRFFVSGIPDPLLGERAVLVIEDDPWPPADCTELLSRLSSLLPPRTCPRSIIFLSNFPETPSGKILRRLPSPIPPVSP
jgi:O-succinylbenzoic acid--CoA ligase